MDKIDYKKTQKELYAPGRKPSIVDVPEMTFIAVDGKGDPNQCADYKQAIEVLYVLSYTIKMNKDVKTRPDGYFEYVVLPLEGLWWSEDKDFLMHPGINKEKFIWTSIIRQPEFVTEEVFEQAKEQVRKKKPELDLSIARLMQYKEGLCVQAMHYGSYDEEAATIQKMEESLQQTEYSMDLSEARRHHEIYLSDPRRTAMDKRKTVIRYPIAKKQEING